MWSRDLVEGLLEMGATDILGWTECQSAKKISSSPETIFICTISANRSAYPGGSTWHFVWVADTWNWSMPGDRKSLTFLDKILFSAACPNQPGQGHVNCQWPGSGRIYSTSRALLALIGPDGRSGRWRRLSRGIVRTFSLLSRILIMPERSHAFQPWYIRA